MCDDKVTAVDGVGIPCGISEVTMMVGGQKLPLRCLVLERMVSAYKVILGMDVLKRLGGVTVRDQEVRFGLVTEMAADVIELEDLDFHARFDGQCWTL